VTYGHGLELDDGDLVLTGGRLSEVDGLANLVQALTLRVLTPLGDDRFDTRYGFDAAAVFGQPVGAPAVADLIRLNLVRTLATDPRVAEVSDVSFLDPAAGRTGRVWTVAVTVVTADGSPQTLTVRVGV
jgi:hypothetical protein